MTIGCFAGNITTLFYFRTNCCRYKNFGFFFAGLLKYHHQGSYQHIVMPENNDQGRIALYYSLAASALAHLKGTSVSLVNVFESLSEQMEEVLLILRRAAGTYFDLMEKISSGSMYHLEKELTDEGKKLLYNKKIDEFLKLYSEYKENPTEELKNRISKISDELRLIDEKFSFSLEA